MNQSQQRKIIHIDMDCFYAAIEIRDRPELVHQPVAVGGRADRRGVLCTANYEARRYGVRSAMATAHALRLCPDLVLLPVDIKKYSRVSAEIRTIFQQYTTQIEPLSLDEAYLDVTDVKHCRGSATLIAEEIREKIFNAHQLTASAGVGPNKFIAKVASDWNKPNGIKVVKPGEVDDFVRVLAVDQIWGVGKVTASRLHQLDIKTCGDLQTWSLERLQHEFGRFGEHLYQLCRGIDQRRVEPRRMRKSLGVEQTFSVDLKSERDCIQAVNELYKELERRLARFYERLALEEIECPGVKALVVKIKYHDFAQTTVQCSSAHVDLALFQRLFIQRYYQQPAAVRLLGVSVVFCESGEARQSQPLQLELPFT